MFTTKICVWPGLQSCSAESGTFLEGLRKRSRIKEKINVLRSEKSILDCSYFRKELNSFCFTFFIFWSEFDSKLQKENLIALSLLAFSVFVFIQDPRIENFWPLIGISLAGLTIIISVVGILGISCSSGHCLNLHIVLATCSLFVYASISVFSGLRFSGNFFFL